MLRIEEVQQLFFSSLNSMGGLDSQRGPRSIIRTLKKEADYDDLEFTEDDFDKIISGLNDDDPNNYFFTKLGVYLRQWDAATEVKWVDKTKPYSDERRSFIFKLLELPELIITSMNAKLPPYRPDGHPIIIADEHEEWYTAERKRESNFYWAAYSKYLGQHGSWPEESIIELDKASDMIVRRLSDPQREAIKQTKGLVVGYVQSGKTANFTAVIAKAADAGYKLIIVIAGTLNILREQTQRRFDKELIGKELIESERSDHDYIDAPDWEEFVYHGDLPSQLGSFDWKRLTGEKDDYKKLQRGLEALEFKSAIKGRRFNDPVNLKNSSATLIVIKKIPSVLKKLNEDLADLATHLEEVPALIIDDESDQASVNTVNPDKITEKERTATNEQIIKLVRTLNRAQYVGYTATPFANVFINPKDAEDLFPSEYIVALPRPKDYMGIYDFFDFAEDLAEPDDNSERPKEISHIRNTSDDKKNDDGNLSEAINAFILAGAIKLYRKSKDVDVSTKHHTMLVHRSVRKLDHEEDALLVQSLYDKSKPGAASFYKKLKELWKKDFNRISIYLGIYKENPKSFEELRPFIDDCVSHIQKDGKEVRIINGDKKNEKDMPNFDRDEIWSILVGGTKLSRGYTVEGLTVSYYRRRIKTADTLMQVGRWFGFRKGYQDLVRLYVSRNEQDRKNKTMDLYAAFKSICRDEEIFRKELEMYSDERDPRILPENIPPRVPSHLIPPTAKNKSWYVTIQHQNFGGSWKESGHPNNSDSGRKSNAKLFKELLGSAAPLGRKSLSYKYFDKKKNKKLLEKTNYLVWEGTKDNLIKFLEGYKWNVPGLLSRELNFLGGEGGKDPKISRCIILCPQKITDKHKWNGMSVKNRARINNGSFNGFSEPKHVRIAQAISLIDPPDSSNKALNDLINKETAVIIAYPTIGTNDDFSSEVITDKDITIGFGVKFPKNNIKTPITWGHNTK